MTKVQDRYVTLATRATARLSIDTPIGTLVLEGDGTALTHVWLPGETERRAAEVGAAAGGGARGAVPKPLRAAAAQLGEYFSAKRTTFALPLAPTGTAFQLAVWKALADIPYGETITYGELARRVGRPAAFRAVGQANGANPIPIVYPCHRVVASGGRLGGYGGGLETKRRLLALEGVSSFETGSREAATIARPVVDSSPSSSWTSRHDGRGR